jgi:hypothetical protein
MDWLIVVSASAHQFPRSASHNTCGEKQKQEQKSKVPYNNHTLDTAALHGTV